MRKVLWVVIAWMTFMSFAWAQPSLSGYRHACIPRPTSDNWGLWAVLYDSVRASGLDAFTDVSNMPSEERMRTVVVRMSTWGDLTQYARIQVNDFYTNALIKETSEWARMHIGVRACAIAAVQHAWAAVGYRGYDDAAFQANLALLYPSRPTLPLTIEKLKEMPLKNPIEGIWSDNENKYTIGVVKDPTSKYADYVGIILKTNVLTWKVGEIKFEFNETAGGMAYTGNTYLFNKQRIGATFMLDTNGTLLKFDIQGPNNTTNRAVWMKIYPQVSASPTPGGPSGATPSPASWTGSGFLISATGLVATNHHVAGNATSLKLSFPKVGKDFPAKLLLKDPNNDLAILQIDGFSLASISQTELPYGFKRTRTVSMGDPVYTIGYPLTPVLGRNAKYTNGTISSKSGIGDDMVHLQINAPIQPGNSGSPLFDESGNVIGVVVASLNAEWMRAHFGTVPQNVNYAVKVDYLLNLADMLPTSLRLPEAQKKPTPEQVEPFVCLISAQ